MATASAVLRPRGRGCWREGTPLVWAGAGGWLDVRRGRDTRKRAPQTGYMADKDDGDGRRMVGRGGKRATRPGRGSFAAARNVPPPGPQLKGGSLGALARSDVHVCPGGDVETGGVGPLDRASRGAQESMGGRGAKNRGGGRERGGGLGEEDGGGAHEGIRAQCSLTVPSPPPAPCPGVHGLCAGRPGVQEHVGWRDKQFAPQPAETPAQTRMAALPAPGPPIVAPTRARKAALAADAQPRRIEKLRNGEMENFACGCHQPPTQQRLSGRRRDQRPAMVNPNNRPRSMPSCLASPPLASPRLPLPCGPFAGPLAAAPPSETCASLVAPDLPMPTPTMPDLAPGPATAASHRGSLARLPHDVVLRWPAVADDPLLTTLVGQTPRRVDRPPT